MDVRPFSACVIVKNIHGKVLGVTRKTNHNDWGLPGGKLDNGEDKSTCIRREVKEETGLTLTHLIYHITYDCIDIDGQMKPCAVFTGSVEGTINHNEPHKVDWVDQEVLYQGSFGQFNQKVFAAIMEP